MILSYSGDAFLIRRAARAALVERGARAGDVTEVGEGMDAAMVRDLASQGGLFGDATLLLDFGAAFAGQAGVKPRNDVMASLRALTDGPTILVLDPDATPARQKNWRELGEHHHLTLPKGERLVDWVRTELRAAQVDAEPTVPAYLADVFGEDAAGIVSEIQKLAVLEGRLPLDRVKATVNRESTRDAFDLIERITAGDVAGAVAISENLLAAGEAVPRIFGALSWQFVLVAKAVGVRSRSGGRVGGSQAAKLLGVAPFAAEKAMRIAAALDEAAVRSALADLLEADVAAKTGRDPELALESAVIALARRWARRSTPAGHSSGR